MKLHLVALPHTQITSDFCGCAYTAKILKFCKMLGQQYEIVVYAPEGPDPVGATLVSCLTNDERLKLFGPDDNGRLPNWPTDDQCAQFNNNVIRELKEHFEPNDLILLSAGWSHRAIATMFSNAICCEPGVGYEGILTNFCAFESYAWMHHVYARKGINDGRWFDTVIPNYFDPDEFPKLNNGKGEYLLFLGRLIKRKGPDVASEIAQRTGHKLIVAGAGGQQVGAHINGQGVQVQNATYIGPVNIIERAELLANAKALIVPTTYVEPFGGVAVEAMMCGTPVIATDWGAFTETVKNGLSGFRFRTLGEAIWSVNQLDLLDPKTVRAYARQQYSLSAVAPMFERWFRRLDSLWCDGWYTEKVA
jgi:glycosyltransferase involved in cell wall biosynthesis